MYESAFSVRLDLVGTPVEGQRAEVAAALRRVADELEDYPMTEPGQRRIVRRGRDDRGIGADWEWRA